MESYAFRTDHQGCVTAINATRIDKVLKADTRPVLTDSIKNMPDLPDYIKVGT